MGLYRAWKRSLMRRLWAERRARRKAENQLLVMEVLCQDARNRLYLLSVDHAGLRKVAESLQHELDKKCLPSSMPRSHPK